MIEGRSINFIEQAIPRLCRKSLQLGALTSLREFKADNADTDNAVRPQFPRRRIPAFEQSRFSRRRA
jgi:hypothetical protein